MSEETKAAFQKMRFYKFYPVQKPDTPDISNVKVKFGDNCFLFIQCKGPLSFYYAIPSSKAALMLLARP